MIGAVVYMLRAENSAPLPLINGRLMHAAFFKIINEYSLTLGSFVHNEQNLKPFTVSFLESAEEIEIVEERRQVRRGEKFFWRVTGLNKEILQAALSVRVGEKIQVGGLILRVEKIICDGRIRADSGVVSVEDFISSVKHAPPVKEICFEFVSPVSFRIDEFDAPYPRPELIFASLADKWTQSEMPATVDKKFIREIAAQIRLTQWSGECKKFYFGRDRGTLAFLGQFFYNVEALNNNFKKVFLLLAKFGEFAGVGRLTGQGFGQARVSWLNAKTL